MANIVFVVIFFIAFVDLQAQTNPLWISRYNSQNNYSDYGQSICEDRKGNIIVTGYTLNQNQSVEVVTLKYSNDGQEIWTGRIQSMNGFAIYTSGVVVDKGNNIYIAGNLYRSTPYDLTYAFISKYDQNGNLKFFRNDSTSNYNSCNFIRISSNNEIYLGEGNGGGSHMTVTKYDTSGNKLWQWQYIDSLGMVSSVKGMEIGDSGSIYVSGYSDYGGSGGYILTLKLLSNGNLQWLRTYVHTNSYAEGLILDNKGNVIVTGEE